MKSIWLYLILGCSLCFSVSAQDRIDTLYYTRSGQKAPNQLFADYYRIALYPADSTKPKVFKDFYRTGETRCEGHFLSLDSTEDAHSIFDGEIVMFNKNGTVAEKSHYINGKRTGEFLRYSPEGALRVQTFYVNGKIDGILKRYQDNGSCRIEEYDAGKLAKDYYLLADSLGNTLKYRIANGSPIWESPLPTERMIEYRDGVPYEIYFKNGLTIALRSTIKRDYGKWFRIDLIITNRSLTPIEITPETNIIAVAFDEDNAATDLKVWSGEEYMKKVKRSQTLAAVLMGFSEGFSTAGAGFATSTTTFHSSYGGYASLQTTTYSPTAAAQATLASQQRIVNFSQALQNEKEIKQLGYLKKNTIYPGESVSGYILIDCNKGLRLVVNVHIEEAEYLYEWGIGKKETFILEK